MEHRDIPEKLTVENRYSPFGSRGRIMWTLCFCVDDAHAFSPEPM